MLVTFSADLMLELEQFQLMCVSVWCRLIKVCSWSIWANSTCRPLNSS